MIILGRQRRRLGRAFSHRLMLMTLAIGGCICLGVAPAGAHVRSLKTDAAVFDHAVHIKVSGLPAGKHVLVQVVGASLQLFPTNGSTTSPAYASNGASKVNLFRDGALISSTASTPLDASLDLTAKMQDGSAPALTGTATIPDGASVTIAVDRRDPVHVDNGDFSVPFG